MAWHDDPKHPFAGICEKLKRADQNIDNIHAEIGEFFAKCEYPTIPDYEDDRWQEAVDYHKKLVVPLRFSVLAGEVIHHFRSCLDHIVWYFSSASYREDERTARRIEFPIFSKPLTEEQQVLYDRKIKGITKPSVRKLIGDLQPHTRRTDPLNDPLCIIHDMDRFDKHRELAIVTGSAQIEFPAGTSVDLVRSAIAHTQGKTVGKDVLAAIGTQIKKHHHVSPDISFAQFGEWKTQSIVPSLTHLLDAVAAVVDLFIIEV